jgi:predicted Zn-dependent peptidase
LSSSRPSANLDVKITRLPNGVVVATETLPKVRSASIGVYLDIGSRDEVPATNGLAHLFEHMVFKGTKKHDALQIVKVFESTGGQVNAYTSKEQTCFYAKVVDSEVEAGLSMLLEMVLESEFDSRELAKEKDVIVEEIKAGYDNPEDYVYDLFSEAFFSGNTLGFPIAGTEKTVRGLTRAHLVEHARKAETSLPLFVVAVGHVDHAHVVDIARKAFRLRKDGKSFPARSPGVRSANGRAAALALPRKAADRPLAELRPRHLLEPRSVNQVTAVLGGPSYDWNHPNRYALLLLNCVLGDGMSSKLFQSVREALGLVYNIYSNPEFLINAGVFAIGFATEPKDLPRALKEINRQVGLLRKGGLKPSELEFAKANIRGGILLGLESTSTRMATLSRQLMYGRTEETVDRVLERLSKVTLADVRRCIDDVFRSERWASAAVVPSKAKLSLGKRIAF